MAEDEPTTDDRLRTVWADYSGFRRAVSQLVRLEPAQLMELKSATESGFGRLGSAPSVLAGQPSNVVAAVESLHTMVIDGATGNEIWETIRQLATVTPPPDAKDFQEQLRAKWDLLVDLIGPRAAYDHSALVDRIQRRAMAALDDISFDVDLRMTEINGVPKLVPVVLARLRFDEEPMTSGTALTFQVPDAVLEEFTKALTQLKERLEKAQRAFQDYLF